jgi:glutamate synthase (NADPH/NADH) small chain
VVGALQPRVAQVACNCARLQSVSTKRVGGSGVQLQRAFCAEVQWRKTAQGLRPEEVSGTDFTLDVDLVLLAMGFLHVPHSRLLDELGVEFDARGNIRTQHYQTTADGVFAAGDAHTGASLVVTAIWHGRQAARAVDEYLR